MRENYYLSILGIFICCSLYSQSMDGNYKSYTDSLATAAHTALDNYDYNGAISRSLELIDVALEKEDYDNLNRGYNVLGISYEILEDSVRARENYQMALEFARKTGNDTLLWGAYNNLGNVFSSNKNTVDRGLAYYNEAIELASAFEGSQSILLPVVNIGWTYLENGQYDQAFPYLQKASSILQKDGRKATETDLSTLYGMYYSGKGDYEAARENFQKAIFKAERDSLIVEAGFAYEEFSKMLSKTGRFEEAYEALKKHQEFNEDIFQKEKNLQREAVYGRFETETYKRNLAAAEREQQYKDEVLEKTQQLSMIMVISMVVLVIFLVLLLRGNRIRNRLIAQLRDKNEELQKSKEEAERLSLLKTRFFSTVSHELRTPLYGVVGLASLLLEESKDDNQREDLKSLKFSADYLLALINDVLQMNKMDSNLVQLENSNFQIDELLNGIIKSFETTRNLNHNKIELNIDPEIPKNLIGDSMRLSQIMMNLVGNAVKFTEGGRVWIKAEKRSCPKHECYIYFEVGDTGQGIPEDKQQEIFKEFSQLKSNNFSYQGTGLGLPIVKKLLHLFNSEIVLQSSPGEGSIFSFEIGFERAGEEITEKPVEEITDGEVPPWLRKILIVDDNRINQVVTQRILQKHHFECHIAASGEEAIEKLKTEQIEVVLMDVNMPGMNGMETTQEIRKFNPGVPIIALTAVEVGEMREEIFAAGMNDIINKPYNIPQFFETIFRNLRQPTV